MRHGPDHADGYGKRPVCDRRLCTAHGAMYKGKSAGSIGHIGAWSFCQDKIMTTGGEGGMVTTNDENCGKKCGPIKIMAKTLTASITNNIHRVSAGCMTHFGTNWRMMEMQAVIGRIQLKAHARMDCKNALPIMHSAF